MAKSDLTVARITRKWHLAHLLKYYPRPPCTPSLIKSGTLRIVQTHFLLFWNSLYVYTRGILGCLLGFWPLGQNPAGAVKKLLLLFLYIKQIDNNWNHAEFWPLTVHWLYSTLKKNPPDNTTTLSSLLKQARSKIRGQKAAIYKSMANVEMSQAVGVQVGLSPHLTHFVFSRVWRHVA